MLTFTDEEVHALLNSSRASLKLAEDGATYFEQFSPNMESAHEKLKRKWEEIKGGD